MLCACDWLPHKMNHDCGLLLRNRYYDYDLLLRNRYYDYDLSLRILCRGCGLCLLFLFVNLKYLLLSALNRLMLYNYR